MAGASSTGNPQIFRRHHTFRSRQFSDLYEQIMASNSDIEPLTARETETLRLIAEPKTTKEIAAQMGISITKLSS